MISSLLFGISELQEVCLLEVGLYHSRSDLAFKIRIILLPFGFTAIGTSQFRALLSQDSSRFSLPGGLDFRLFMFAQRLEVLSQEMLDSFEKNSESFFVLKNPAAASKAGALHNILQKSTTQFYRIKGGGDSGRPPATDNF